MEIITSRQNALCTHLRKLASSVSYRHKSGEFLCDSPKLLEEALLWQGDLHTVVCTENAALPPLPAGVRQVTVPSDVMKSISPAESPQGVLSVCGLPERHLPEKLEGKRYVYHNMEFFRKEVKMGEIFPEEALTKDTKITCRLYNGELVEVKQ